MSSCGGGELSSVTRLATTEKHWSQLLYFDCLSFSYGAFPVSSCPRNGIFFSLVFLSELQCGQGCTQDYDHVKSPSLCSEVPQRCLGFWYVGQISLSIVRSSSDCCCVPPPLKCTLVLNNVLLSHWIPFISSSSFFAALYHMIWVQINHKEILSWVWFSTWVKFCVLSFGFIWALSVYSTIYIFFSIALFNYTTFIRQQSTKVILKPVALNLSGLRPGNVWNGFI